MPEPSTAESWDPDTWLADLKLRLQLAGDGYMERVEHEDPEQQHPNHEDVRLNRTSFAMLAVGTILNKLNELPGMNEHVGLVPIHDLVAAMRELGKGGRPTLLQPVPGIGTGREHIAQRWVRQHALLCVALLEASGMKGRPACRVVAEALSKQGHLGRLRHDGPRALSEGTVVHWRDRSRQRDFKIKDPDVAAFLDRNLKRIRGLPGWPFSPERTSLFVREMLASPLIRSKSE